MGTQDFHFSGRELPDYIRLSDTQASGTVGNSYATGAWRTMVVNTEEQDVAGHCALSSNQMTLAAGTYSFRLVVSRSDVSTDVLAAIRLRNTTDSTTLLKQATFGLSTVYNNAIHHVLEGRFDVAASKALEIQIDPHATFNFLARTDGENEIYLIVEFWKLA
jgi:hypothetical protein